MISTLKDLIALIEKWNLWKEVEANANKVPNLEARIVALKDRLKRAPGEACPKCGALEFRTNRTERTGPLNAVINRHLKCGSCEHTEVRIETPKTR